jgi:hypothetical protein
MSAKQSPFFIRSGYNNASAHAEKKQFHFSHKGITNKTNLDIPQAISIAPCAK